MKLLSYAAAGKPGYGGFVSGGIVDLGRRTRYPTLRAALAAGAIAELQAAATDVAADFKLSDVTLLTPIPDAEKVICVGVNYKGHIFELGRKLPEQPSVFLRLHSSLVAHGMPLVRPKVSQDFDYEGELAAIIGKGGRHISEEAALDHVAGYTCFNDGSVRDYQMKGSVSIGKNFTSTGSVGPWMVTADEIPDLARLTLETRLNGRQVQHTGLDDLIFGLPAIIAYISAAIPLAPGDVIATGTPEGVAMGRTPPVWMKSGDVVEVEISGIGRLRNPIVDEA
jgi:2-keto-4-pentenoate hydratase/2-oxohepta-3-ene-1,7-dioic acid hydratase in catechol pathway